MKKTGNPFNQKHVAKLVTIIIFRHFVGWAVSDVALPWVQSIIPRLLYHRLYNSIQISLDVCLCVCYLTVWVPSDMIRRRAGMTSHCLHTLHICPQSKCYTARRRSPQAGKDIHPETWSRRLLPPVLIRNKTPDSSQIPRARLTWHAPSIHTPWCLVSRQKVPSWAGTSSCRSPLTVVHCRSHGLLEMLM